MKRPDFNNPDDTFSGVVVVLAIAATFWFVLVKLPVLAGGVA